jgi:hypothetical protein
MTDYTSQITAWYQAIQFRTPPAAELASFNAQLQAGVLTTTQAITQIEISTYTVTYVDPVIRMYQAGLGRVPDQAGQSYWVNAFAAGTASLAQIATIFANSAEFGTTYGANANTPSSPALITALYTNILGRAPDQAGLAYWSAQNLTASQLLQAFSTSAEFIADTAGPIQVYQNLEVQGTEPTTGTLFQKALIPPPGFGPTFVLTTGQDTVGTPYTLVTGTAGTGDQTLTDGDNISTVQTVAITTAGSGVAPGVATINGASNVNITAAASNVYNALLWTNVGAINVVNLGATAQTTGIANAPIGSTYTLAGGANTSSLNIGFSTTGAANFGLLGTGISAALRATLDATGTVAGVNGLANALTGATIATTGANFDVVNLGTNASKVTVTGAGVNDFSFGSLAKTTTVDFSGTTANQTYTFQSGQINGLTLKGGTGALNTVTANGFTGATALTSSGVQALNTTFTNGNTTFDGTNVTGLRTLSVGLSTGNDTFNNMTGVRTVNIVGPVTGPLAPPTLASPSITYNGTAAEATDPNDPIFNLISGPGALTFGGLSVTNEQNVTVNFDYVSGMIALSAVGAVQVDNFVTHNLTLNNVAAGSVAVVALSGTQAVQNLTVETVAATAANVGGASSFALLQGDTSAKSSVMHVTNFLAPVILDTLAANVNVIAGGNDSTAWLSGVADPISFGKIVVDAKGDGSSALLGPHSISPVITDVTTLGSIQEIDVLAEGRVSFARLGAFVAGASVGTVNVKALGDGSSATIDFGAAVAGNIQNVNVWAEGTNSTAVLEHVTALSFGTVDIKADGAGSFALVNNVLGLTGNINHVTVEANGNSSFAGLVEAIPVVPTLFAAGDWNTVDVVASGADSIAVLAFPDFTFSNIGQVNVTASGVSSFAFGEVAALQSIQSATLTASAVGSLAIEVLDPLNIGTVSVHSTALGDGTPNFGLPAALVNIPIPSPLITLASPLTFPGFGTESTAVLVYTDTQITNGGVVNADGAGFFEMISIDNGGFTVNATNSGGFEYLFAPAFFGVPPTYPGDNFLTTTINSTASQLNYIQSGVEQTIINVTNFATGTPLPGHLQGNTFDLSTSFSSGNYDAFGLSGAGLGTGDATGAAQEALFLSTTGGAATEIIQHGFTSGGTNAFGVQGQLILGDGPGTATNFKVDGAASTGQLIKDAAAQFLSAGNTVTYEEATIGGNIFIAVQGHGTGATSVVQLVEIVGAGASTGTAITFHDIFA